MKYEEKYTDITALKGKTITAISQLEEDRIEMSMSDGTSYALLHNQECCESVNIYDVRGELESLIGSPITVGTHDLTINGRTI